MRNNRYILILSSLALVFGCTREQPEPIERQYGEPIPYSVSVDAGPLTRVAFDGEDINSGDYKFATGDQLYISDAGGNISGILSITSGVGSNTATFDGELTPVVDFTPTADTDLVITLVGSSQINNSFFPISGGRITGAPTYPSTIPASTSVADLVQNYSHFTANVKYGVRSYTLHQQTVFLNFRLDLLASSITGSPATVDVDIKSADGNTTLRTVSGVTIGGNASIACLQFTTIFPAGTSLQGAQIVVDNGSGIHCTPDFASDLTLEANKYYAVSRTNVEPFTVEAPAGGNGLTITLKYENLQYRRYTDGAWTDWEDCPASIIISAGNKINLRGKGTSYYNSDNSHPLFTIDNNYTANIYGDIMSLMCDSEWDRTSTVGTRAFSQTFKGIRVNIPADKELLLSAVTLGTSCYEGMFQGCTVLKKSPVLPATASAEACYKSMFEGCTALVDPPSSIPFTTLAKSACNRMFFGCTNLTSSPEFSNSLTEVGESGCSEMFSGCSKLKDPPSSLPAGTLRFKAYYKMFWSCVKLESIPEFPHTDGVVYDLAAGTSAENNQQNGLCYQMFYKCDALTSLAGKKLFNSITPLKLGCFNDMFSTCANLATVPEDFLPALTLAKSCYRGMFQQCKKLTKAPYLPAATLEDHCYRFMFNTCTSLVEIKCYSTTSVSNDAYTQNWLANAKNTSDCKFHYRSGTSWYRNNNSGVPEYWEMIAETVQ